ncbi:MAG: FHA domain-containing protein [Verrucomicrobiota bacterium]
MATLTIYLPEKDPIEVALDQVEQVSVGRGPENDLVIDDVSMSGSHAVVQNLGGSYQVNDLDSTNGTFANGSPISEHALVHGDRIMFGSIEAVFAEEATTAEAPAEAGATDEAAQMEGHYAPVAEASNVPLGFSNLSPIEKVEKKDSLGQIAMLIGVVSIVAAIAVIALAAMMKAA